MNEYSTHEYGKMIADRRRVEAYLDAMRQTVEETSVVLDLGTGTGFFALWACRLGARKVYAVDPSDAIEVARKIAAENRCEDRIEFIQELSTEVTLPEPVDLIVSDLRGIMPFYGHHIPAIADARRRFLAPGGHLVPESDSLWLAVVESPAKYDQITCPWSREQSGWQMEAAHRVVTSRCYKCRVLPEQLLTEPACWAGLDYTSLETPHCEAETRLRASRRGTAHGLCLWFDSVLAPGVRMSNSPDEEELLYGHGFFPFPSPIDLDRGDEVSVLIKAKLVGDDYVWNWETRVSGAENPQGVKAHFRQSTFHATPVSLDSLRRRSPDHVPGLTPQGQTVRFVLDLMHAHLPNGEIASRLLDRFPARFPDLDTAQNCVSELAVQFSLPHGASC
jgi:protein arginine N-methyltransferase 1